MGWLPNRLPTAVVWLDIDVPACRALPWRGSKEVRPLIDLKLGMPATGPAGTRVERGSRWRQ